MKLLTIIEKKEYKWYLLILEVAKLIISLILPHVDNAAPLCHIIFVHILKE